jgi:hypothetical protein
MDKGRRKFLKIILIGSGVLLAEKILSPLFSKLPADSSTKTNLAAPRGSGTFRVVENKKILSVYDNSGEEIFQIDKET